MSRMASSSDSAGSEATPALFVLTDLTFTSRVLLATVASHHSVQNQIAHEKSRTHCHGQFQHDLHSTAEPENSDTLGIRGHGSLRPGSCIGGSNRRRDKSLYINGIDGRLNTRFGRACSRAGPGVSELDRWGALSGAAGDGVRPCYGHRPTVGKPPTVATRNIGRSGPPVLSPWRGEFRLRDRPYHGPQDVAAVAGGGAGSLPTPAFSSWRLRGGRSWASSLRHVAWTASSVLQLSVTTL